MAENNEKENVKPIVCFAPPPKRAVVNNKIVKFKKINEQMPPLNVEENFIPNEQIPVEQVEKRKSKSYIYKMKAPKAVTLGVFFLCLVFTCTSLYPNSELFGYLENITVMSAAVTSPQGGNRLIQEAFAVLLNTDDTKVIASSNSSQISSLEPTLSQASSENTSSNVTSSSNISSSEVSSALQEETLNGKGYISVEKKTYVLGNQSYNTGNSVVNVLNKTTKYQGIDIGKELAKTPDVAIEKNSNDYQVLIYHTHTSEAYQKNTSESYLKNDYITRTDDTNYSVVKAGEIITDKLNESGIKTMHCTVYHDSPMYNGAYTRSLATVEEILRKNPSIQVVIDLHRDSIAPSDSTSVKPVATIDGKDAAQIMLIAGCDENGDLGYPDWEMNLRFALQMQESMNTLYSDLARPVLFKNIRYNQHLSHGAFLAEFGTDANSIEEVCYSAELFANSLINLVEN